MDTESEAESKVAADAVAQAMVKINEAMLRALFEVIGYLSVDKFRLEAENESLRAQLAERDIRKEAME